MKTIEHFKCYIEELVSQLGDVKQRQDSERRELLELREAIKSTMTVKEVVFSFVSYCRPRNASLITPCLSSPLFATPHHNILSWQIFSRNVFPLRYNSKGILLSAALVNSGLINN